MAYKVSVCIPTYRHAQDVRRLLDSLCTQTYPDFAVFLSDDTEDDSIERLVSSYETTPLAGRITYRHNKEKLGFVFNWNAAIEMSDGEYIKIIFSDDFLTTQGSLAAYAAMLDSHPEASLAFSGSRQVTLTADGQSGPDDYDLCADDAFLDALKRDPYHLFFGNEIGAPSATIYRRTSPPMLFDKKSGFASDVFLYLDILGNNPCFVSTKEPLISIGLHGDQYTETFNDRDPRIYDDYRYMYEKYSLWQRTDCKLHFLRQYLLPFGKGPEEAKACHISAGLYYREKLPLYASAIRYRLSLIIPHSKATTP